MGVLNCGIFCACTMYKRNRSYLNLLFYDLSGRFEGMVCFFPVCNSAKGRRTLVVFLASVWVLGLVLGLATVFVSDPAFLALLQIAPDCPVSVGGLLISALLPTLFTAMAVIISCRWLLIPIAFLKAFLLSALSCGFVLAYSSGGWLVAVMFLFSDYLCTCALLWYWFRLILKKPAAVHCFAVLAVFTVAGFLNYWYISPFLANLL